MHGEMSNPATKLYIYLHIQFVLTQQTWTGKAALCGVCNNSTMN